MTINYKILCEVKLLHEYYLSDQDGTTIFDKALQQERLDYLQGRANFRQPSIEKDLVFEVPESAQAVFNNYKLRLVRSYSGFKIFAAVKEQALGGGIKGFRPEFSLHDSLPVIVSLRPQTPVLDTLSNSPLRKALPAKYYFTNRNLGDAQSFPVLSRPLPLRDDTLTYEQGDLVLDSGDNLVKAFFFGTDASKNWHVVNGNGFANSNDLSLLPPEFYYSFSKADAITSATFTLKNSNGDVVSSVTKNGSLLEGVRLDFSTAAPVILDGVSTALPEVHTLEVAGNGGFARVHSVVFADRKLAASGTWGVIHLNPRVADPQYNLLGDDGLLFTRRNADGTKTPHPIFEIRVKSRFSFWKYISQTGEKILDNATLHPFLDYDAASGSFETKQMLNASYLPMDFGSLGIPSPETDTFLESDKKRVFISIRVPKSNLFKV